MRDIPRVTFLVIADAFVLALLVMVLSSCVATPSKYRDRNGDFIMNIGSTADTVAKAPAANVSAAFGKASASGRDLIRPGD